MDLQSGLNATKRHYVGLLFYCGTLIQIDITVDMDHQEDGRLEDVFGLCNLIYKSILQCIKQSEIFYHLYGKTTLQAWLPR